jgi:integrase
MKGHLKERAPGKWAIILDVADPVTGKRRRKWHSFRGTKREAQKECARLIAELASGAYVQRTKQTVAEFLTGRIQQWEAAGDITARSAARYRILHQRQIVPHVGGVELQKLTRLGIEAWHNALRTTGIASRTMAFAHRLLSKALADAERDGLINKNVCRVQRAPRVVAAKEIIIVKDVAAFEAHIRGNRLYPMAILALFRGLRLGEVLALRWEHVDPEAGIIRVRQALEETVAHGVRFKEPKSKAGRRDITLPDIVVTALHEHRKALLEMRLKLGLGGKLQPTDLLFANIDGQPLRPASVSNSFALLAERIGMPDITLHALRHTHASQLIANGTDIATVARRLGHADPSVTLKTYTHFFAIDDRKAAAAINQALGG